MSECLEVYSVAITSPDCRYHTIKSMPTFPEDAAVRVLRRERAAVPPLFKCKYLTEPLNRYAINMDPLKGGRCLNVASGAKRSQGQIWKSNADPLDQDWLNFAFSSSPPPKPILSATACLYLIVRHDQQLWHLLVTLCFLSGPKEANSWVIYINVCLNKYCKTILKCTEFGVNVFLLYSPVLFLIG